MTVFWSNGLVGFITTLAILLLLWPLLGRTAAGRYVLRLLGGWVTWLTLVVVKRAQAVTPGSRPQ